MGELFDEKMIKHLMTKYKLGDIDATCIYYDIVTALRKTVEKEGKVV